MNYHAYGTVIQTNRSWPTLSVASRRTETLSVQVERIPALPPSQPIVGTKLLQGRTIQASGDFPDIQLRVDDLLLFSFERRNRRIHCFAVPDAQDAIIDYWLLWHFIPTARFLWNEAEILHSAAVRIGEDVAALLAPAGTGKSTLTAAFVARGHAVVSDDYLLLRNPEGRESGVVNAMSSVPHYRDSRELESLGKHTTQYDPAPGRLRVIYVLKVADPGASVEISALSDSDAAVELLRQAPYNRKVFAYPVGPSLAREHFEWIANLPRKVRVSRLDVPRCLTRLPDVYRCVVSDFLERKIKTAA